MKLSFKESRHLPVGQMNDISDCNCKEIFS